MRHDALALGLVLSLAFAAACTKRPVLYPNERLAQVGEATAKADIDHCVELAEAGGAESSSSGSETAGRTVGGAALGAATGAAIGAVVGSAGRGAAMGAAGGGVSGLLAGVFGPHDPDPVHRNYVERCLKDLGYEPIGWK